MTEAYLNALDASEKSCDGDGEVVTVSNDGTKLTLKKDKDIKCAFAFENTEKKTVTIKVKTDFKVNTFSFKTAYNLIMFHSN